MASEYNIKMKETNPYTDILRKMGGKKTIHVDIVDLWGEGCELNEVDVEHLSEAYYQMRKAIDDWENGEIRQLFWSVIDSWNLDNERPLEDGVYFTMDKQYVLAVLDGEIISALYTKDNKDFVRIGPQVFDTYDFL